MSPQGRKITLLSIAIVCFPFLVCPLPVHARGLFHYYNMKPQLSGTTAPA